LWLDASGNAIGFGTPAAFVGTNITGTASGLTAGTVTTNANLTGEATSVGNATTLTNSAVIAKVLTGYTSGAGTVSATDTILQAIQKLNGNDSTNANLTGPITSVGNATSIASQTGTGTKFVVDNTPTLITPVLGVATGTSLTTTGSVTGSELLASNGLVINNMTVGTTYAIPSGYSASSVGPVVISGGVTVTVSAGSRWIVI
jgi:hypothetical protein